MSSRARPRRRAPAVLAVFAVFAALVLLAVVPASWPRLRYFQVAAQAPALTHKLIIRTKDTDAIQALTRQGGRLLVDYGPFAVWTVPDAAVQALTADRRVAVRDDLNRIGLRGGQAIDTAAALARSAPKISSSASGDPFRLVQFVGPIKPEWLERLGGAGVRVVTYMAANAYVVWGDAEVLSRLDALAGSWDVLQWTGPYLPAYRLAPALAARSQAVTPLTGSAWVDVTVQLYAGGPAAETAARLRALNGRVYRPESTLLDLTDLSLQVPADQLSAIAAWPAVFNVEPYAPPQRLDEVQDQIIAGAVTTAGGNVVPSGPGYLNWLAQLGFTTNPADYPIVDVVDDGIDMGDIGNILHPDFHSFGSLTNPSRVAYIGNCTQDAAGDGADGHGNLNAGIVAAYNNRAGSPYQDANGYRIGLGVSPYGRVGGTKIFRNNNGPYDLSKCGGTDVGLVAASFNAGAGLTSDSWGSDVYGAYDGSARSYDILTRDASASTPGNQEMLHVFAAGNKGRFGLSTLDSPGTAKNVLTVAATENVRDNGVTDGCSTAAANADNIADFSSRGPASDGRIKPDLAAPGTHVQGPASQDPTYNGLGVCGKYYPAGQTLYAWSSGTSHSTPAVAGAASLATEYYQRVWDPGATPSPAMLKALLINSARYLTGSGAGVNLPGTGQGWGDVNLGALFDGTPRALVDEKTLFTATGQVFTQTGYIADLSKPLRVTLAWTDAPGPTTGAALVNDLDLEVTAGGNTYRGNVFSGPNSVGGGAADHLNNVESVFLPAGLTGPYEVRVIASNIAADGVPGNGVSPDQDFALVVYNSPGLLDRGGLRWSDSGAGGNGDGIIDPGETADLSIDLVNIGADTAHGIAATLTAAGATLLNASSTYPDIGPAATAPNDSPYRFHVGATAACGTDLVFTQTVTYNGGQRLTHTFRAALGTVAYHGPPVSIPDNDPTGATATINVTTTGIISGVAVHLDVAHSYDGDLDLYLVANGVSVTLSSRNGGGGQGYWGPIFDDQAAATIAAGAPPFTGRFRPDSPLGALSGGSLAGPWSLQVVDRAPLDVGRIVDFGLEFPGTCRRPRIWYLPLVPKNWAP